MPDLIITREDLKRMRALGMRRLCRYGRPAPMHWSSGPDGGDVAIYVTSDRHVWLTVGAPQQHVQAEYVSVRVALNDLSRLRKVFDLIAPRECEACSGNGGSDHDRYHEGFGAVAEWIDCSDCGGTGIAQPGIEVIDA